jgi:hypothetical protein
LFNLKNNPNAKSSSIDNPTKQYKIRRNQVIKNSKKRLGCKIKELPITMKTVKIQTGESVAYDQIYEFDEKGSVSYYVLVDQNIAEVTRGIDGLNEGEVKIDIWNSNNENQYFDLIKFKTPTTGRGKEPTSQNIYTYFSNTAGTNHDNISRDLLISNWMKLNSIEEITVKVSPISQKGTQHPNQKAFNKEMENSSSNDLEKQKGDILQKILAKKGILENKKIPKLLIIQCSDAKNPNGDISSDLNFDFGAKLAELGTIRMKYYENLFDKQPNYFVEKNLSNLQNYKDAFKTNFRMPALNRYNGIFYKNDSDKFENYN